MKQSLGLWLVFASGFSNLAAPLPARQQFQIQSGDVIVFVGGANMVAAQQSGYVETLLTIRFAAKAPRFRSMAWEGDTVYEQRRELNFGSWQDQLKRVGASVIFAQFGQMEALQGSPPLPRFVQAYEKLLDQFSRQTDRIVLLSPAPFEKLKPPLPDLSPRNHDVETFVRAIQTLAEKRNYFFVNVFTPLLEKESNGIRLTEDGVQLNATGHWAVAREIQRQLGLPPALSLLEIELENGKLHPDPAQRLKETIQAKNQLWFDYWRPMNWAFLNGDRTEQPSSRDHRDPKIRWFPEEMKKFLPLIEQKEQEIATIAGGLKVVQ